MDLTAAHCCDCCDFGYRVRPSHCQDSVIEIGRDLPAFHGGWVWRRTAGCHVDLKVLRTLSRALAVRDFGWCVQRVGYEIWWVRGHQLNRGTL